MDELSEFLVNKRLHAAAWAAMLKRPTVWDFAREVEKMEQGTTIRVTRIDGKGFGIIAESPTYKHERDGLGHA